jgi:hypothetical protein
MNPYHDPDCPCRELVRQIDKDFPGCNWNMDDACAAWAERSKTLKRNPIEYEPYSDENYGCNCPTCGRGVCGWCV